jgi:hypothetical protein
MTAKNPISHQQSSKTRDSNFVHGIQYGIILGSRGYRVGLRMNLHRRHDIQLKIRMAATETVKDPLLRDKNCKNMLHLPHDGDFEVV